MTRTIAHRSLPLFAALLIAGCASGYKEFYRPAEYSTPEAVAAMRATTPPGMPVIERAQPGDRRVILDAYAKRGYVMVGSAMFNSGCTESEESAVRQGQEVGADIVLILNPRYYMPFTIHRSDYGAIYFVKQRFDLGAFSRDLNDAERQVLQTNKGAVIQLIVDGTPAFDADLLVGDIVTAVDGIAVTNAKAFSDLLQERRGKQTVLSLLRHGQRIEKTVQLNP